MTQIKSGLSGCKVSIWFGHTRITSESLNATGDDHVWTFDHAPVSTQNLLITGTKAGITRPLVNYTLEPMDGTLTIPASFPAFDSVHASYYYYSGSVPIITKDFDVKYPSHNYEPTIYGEPVYTLSRNYPTTVEFAVVLLYEWERALLTESIRYGYFFLLIDDYIDPAYAQAAYEGPIQSSEAASIYKGKSFLLPIVLEVQQAGAYDETAETINWSAW